MGSGRHAGSSASALAGPESDRDARCSLTARSRQRARFLQRPRDGVRRRPWIGRRDRPMRRRSAPPAHRRGGRRSRQAGDAGFKFLGVVVGKTAFGGKEVISILQKVEK